jgi:hypothetical protein
MPGVRPIADPLHDWGQTPNVHTWVQHEWVRRAPYQIGVTVLNTDGRTVSVAPKETPASRRPGEAELRRARA